MASKIDFHRISISLLGALMLSAACVTAAIAPVKAASTSLTRY